MQVEGTATSIKTTPCADALITHGARAYVPTTVLLSMLAETAADAADLNTPCGDHRRKVECAPRLNVWRAVIRGAEVWNALFSSTYDGVIYYQPKKSFIWRHALFSCVYAAVMREWIVRF